MQKNQNAENVGEVVSYENNGSSKYTTTLWEEENLRKVDDPDVFEFSLSSVSIFVSYFNNCVRDY